MNLKKSLLFLLGAGIIALSGCSSNYSNNEVYSARWLRANLNKPKNEEEIKDYLILNIISEPDLIEEWNSAEKTIRLGSGDCEDIAVVGAYFAEFLGYPPKVLLLREHPFIGHAVTFLEKIDSKQTKYGVIDSPNLIYPEYDSIPGLITHLNKIKHKNYSEYKIINLNSIKKDWRTGKGNICPLSLRIFGFDSVKWKRK